MISPTVAISSLLLMAVTGSATEPSDLRALADTARGTGPLPFATVIQSTTGQQVLSFNTNDPTHQALQTRLSAAAVKVMDTTRSAPIRALRPNEAGTAIESLVKAALKEQGLNARTPHNTEDRAQATGYPDIEIPGDPHCYLELKTYSAAALNSSQRTFYYSPSATPKVTRNALHLLLAFQLEREMREGQTVFLPSHWQILSLESLQVEMKLEFNQSNRGLYGADPGPVVIDESTPSTRP